MGNTVCSQLQQKKKKSLFLNQQICGKTSASMFQIEEVTYEQGAHSASQLIGQDRRCHKVWASQNSHTLCCHDRNDCYVHWLCKLYKKCSYTLQTVQWPALFSSQAWATLWANWFPKLARRGNSVCTPNENDDDNDDEDVGMCVCWVRKIRFCCRSVLKGTVHLFGKSL